MSKKDEFVFINSRPSGADMQQSVNQTCIKLQGSEPAPDPVFWRVNNQGENRGSTIFAFILKISSALEYIKPHRLLFIAHLSCLWGGGASAVRILTILAFLWLGGKESDSISVRPPIWARTRLRMRSHSHTFSPQNKECGSSVMLQVVGSPALCN